MVPSGAAATAINGNDSNECVLYLNSMGCYGDDSPHLGFSAVLRLLFMVYSAESDCQSTVGVTNPVY